MKLLKKLLSLSLVLSMLLVALSGCGSKETPDNASTEAETSQPAEEGEEASTAAPSGDVFTIGGSGPLTGDAASYGISVKQGAQIAIDEINEAGGVNGRTLALNFLDDEAEAQPAISAYNKLMDEGVDVILGNVTSGSTIAITELTNEDGILQITPSGSAVDCTKYDNAFRICFTDPLQGITMADYAVDTLGHKDIAILYNIADDYSKGMANAFMEEVKAKGANIVAEESFTTGDVDFNTQLTNIKAANAEILFIPAYYQDVAYIINQAAQQELGIPFIGGDGWDGVLGQLDDASVAEGSVFLTPFFADDTAENVQNFVTKYEAAYSAKPDQFAADAYDGVYVIKAAIEQSGSFESADLIKAMTEIEVDGTTGKMTFTPEGEPNKAAKLIEIKDGKYSQVQ